MRFLGLCLKALLWVAPLSWIASIAVQPLLFVGGAPIQAHLLSLQLVKGASGYGGMGSNTQAVLVSFSYQDDAHTHVGDCFSSGGNQSNAILGFDEKVEWMKNAVGQSVSAVRSPWSASVCLYNAWPWKTLAVAFAALFACLALAHSPASPLNRKNRIPK